VSIGVAHCDGAAFEVAELLAQADRALYFAKERGRNRVEVASLDMLLTARDAEPGRMRDVAAAKSTVAKSAA
jgi:predicted signal transduction protein with EAL and GGDEF domain